MLQPADDTREPTLLHLAKHRVATAPSDEYRGIWMIGVSKTDRSDGRGH
jgi:hypothetical protein